MFKIAEEQKAKIGLLRARLLASDTGTIDQIVDQAYNEFNKGKVIKLPKFMIRNYCNYIMYSYCINRLEGKR